MRLHDDAIRRAATRTHAPWSPVSPCCRALLFALLAAAFGCNYGGSAGGSSQAASEQETEASVTFIDPLAPGVDSVGAFEDTTYPLLTQYCGECHASGPGSPLIAHTDVDAAFRANVNNQKVNLAVPENSRLVRRLAGDLHHCWSDCDDDATEMAAAIAEWAEMIRVESGPVSVEDGLRTDGLRFDQGIEDTGEERYRDHLVALWEFKRQEGKAADTSGVEPLSPLYLSEEVGRMSSYGLRFDDKRASAVAPASTSRKIYDAIAKPNAGSQQYSIEAWIAPANITQEGPKWVVSYGTETESVNFTLGQNLYNYDYRNRSLAFGIEESGTPALTTYDADEDAQPNLQHVVITYDQFRGRRIYVDAVWTDDEDVQGPGRLWSWDEDAKFYIGNTPGGYKGWEGQVRLVAVYSHALNEEQIQQNFNAGVGRRVLLRFDVSNLTGPGSYLEFVVSELDDYSYLLCQPTFLTPNPNGFRVANLRIAVNGQVAVSGQAFPNVDASITSSKQELSRQCSVISQDLGYQQDVFTVEFEAIGGFEDPTALDEPEYVAPPLPPVQDLPNDGVRDFARLNATMAELTGIDPIASGIRDTWVEISEALPGSYDLRAFSAAQQVAISKLALEYCNALVETPSARMDFFGVGADFTQPATTAFADATARAVFLDPLIDRMLGINVASQPDPVEVRALLDALIDELTVGCDPASCDAVRTRTVATSVCSSLLSSAAVTLH